MHLIHTVLPNFETLRRYELTVECFLFMSPGPGGGVLPYMGYIGMCGPKGYGFSAVLVINRVSIIAILPPLWS